MTPYPFNVKTKLTQKFKYSEKEFQEIREMVLYDCRWSGRESERDINLIYYEI